MRHLAPGALLALLATGGCQAVAPELPARPAPLEPRLVERLRVGVDLPLEPAIAILGTEPPGEVPAGEAPQPLDAETLIRSVERHFPLIQAALEEYEIAAARVMGTAGAFDTQLRASGLSEFEGFYETERLDVALVQPTRLWGAELSTGYRLGTGDFAVYDGKAKTDDGGEFRVGVTVPLLRGREIDRNRVAEWRARIEREQAFPIVTRKRLEATLKAVGTYWSWVAAGRRREVARLLLSLAEDRQAQVDLSVSEGQLAPIASVDNQRTIVDRRTKLFAAERKLQAASIELSLFLRDEAGQPQVPPDLLLPVDFPAPPAPTEVTIVDDVEQALRQRPELQALELELSKLDLDRSLARNSLLPSLELGVFASQDVGAPASSTDDKGPFELSAGLRFGVPLQRRAPRGKERELAAKQNKQRRELQYARDVVRADVQDSVSSIEQSWLRLEQARQNVVLARQLAEAEEVQLLAGESDLFRLNVREQQAAIAAEGLVDALEEHFKGIARYRAVLGVPYDELLDGSDA